MSTFDERFAVMQAEIVALKSTVQKLQPRTTAYIPKYCSLGEHTDIAPTAVLYAGDDARAIHIGDRTKVLRGAEWTGPISVGSGCYVNRDSYIRSNVSIGNNVNIGPFVRLVSDSHEIGASRRRAGKNISLPIVIGDGAWIGSSVTILGGVTIGAGAVVMEGSVVSSDVTPDTLFGGVPARLVKDLS